MPTLLLLFFLLSFTPAAFAEPDLLSFADSLAAEADHYRAITEYKRFLHYHPEDPRVAYAQLEIAQNLLAGQRWEQADSALEKTWKLYPDSPEASAARRLYADSAYARGAYEMARHRYRELKANQMPQDNPELDYKIGLSELQLNEIDNARNSFARTPSPLNRQLQLSIDDYQQLPQKSPRLAGALSAILPGAGQLYTERPRQTAVAFALNAAFIYAAVEAWNNENYAVSGIVSLFEIGWYGGNIYNAMNNAQKYNRRQKHEFLERFQRKFGISLGWQQDHPQLQALYRF